MPAQDMATQETVGGQQLLDALEALTDLGVEPGALCRAVRLFPPALREPGRRAVRDTVLREVVEALLGNPSLTVEAVALSVGFGDVAALSKAFKRWAGRSPASFRAGLSSLGVPLPSARREPRSGRAAQRVRAR